MVLDQLNPSWIRPARDAAYLVAEPIHTVLAWPGQMVTLLSQDLQHMGALKEENRMLREQNLLLAAKLQKMSFLAADNQRLRELRTYANSLKSRALIGEMIAVDGDPMRQVVVINLGSRDGIYSGQVILSSVGVLGRVVQVGKRTSRVMLISDKNHSVPVRVNRSGIRAILSGTSAYEQLRLEYVPEKSDIQVGDLLVTSGLGLDFPEGYPVARVIEIQRKTDDQFLSVTAQPVSSIQRSRYVLALFERPIGAQYLEQSKEASIGVSSLVESDSISAPAAGAAHVKPE